MSTARSGVIAVVSAKGGVGKSLIASNLAAAFAGLHRLPAALIDLAPGLGHADLLLDLRPERSLADLLPVLGELTPRHLDLATTEHPTGLRLLAAQPSLDGDGLLAPDSLPALLAAFRSQFVLTVLDCPAGLDELTRAAVLASDLALAVLTLDAPTLRGTGRLLASFPTGRPIGLVVNQFAAGAPVSLAEVAAHLGQPLLAQLPMDGRAVWANVAYGQPCVLRSGRGLGGALRALAARLVGLAGLVETGERARGLPKGA